MKFILLLSCALYLAVAEPGKKNDQHMEIPTCKRSDPNRDECFINVTMSFKDKVSKGIKELNIPSVDPMAVPSVKLEQNSKNIAFKAILTDLNVKGLSDFNFIDLQTDFNNLTAVSHIIFPRIEFDCNFMIMGKYQMLPLEGSGRFFGNLTNLDMVMENYGVLYYKNKESYLMIHDTQVFFDIESDDVEFDDFTSVGMDKALIFEHLIAYHTDELMNDMKPSMKTILSMIFEDVASKFLDKIPFEKLFPQ